VKDVYSQPELQELLAATPPRTGWDFARMNDLRAPVPWAYAEVVARYVRPADHVLDIGTGDGRVFASLRGRFAGGTGIDPDPEMIRLARRIRPRPTLSSGSATSGSKD
jgi:ubiquinone/menaquinone biosynthesis C-methylase UbiE